MEIEGEPNAEAKKIKWNNKRDEVCGLLCLNNSKDLLFHPDGLTSLNEAWEKLQYLFGNTDKMRFYQLENEMIALSLSIFESLQVYFSKFKTLVL